MVHLTIDVVVNPWNMIYNNDEKGMLGECSFWGRY